MSVRFRCPCPQAALLEADESQIGKLNQCPYCPMRFVVPSPAGAASHPTTVAQQAARADDSPSIACPSSRPTNEDSSGSPAFTLASNQFAFLEDDRPPQPAADAIDPIVYEEKGLLHLACPEGHELEARRDQLGGEVMCPECGIQFRLRMQDTREHAQERALDRQRKELQLGRRALHLAIVSAALILLSLFFMILYAAS